MGRLVRPHKKHRTSSDSLVRKVVRMGKGLLRSAKQGDSKGNGQFSGKQVDKILDDMIKYEK